MTRSANSRGSAWLNGWVLGSVDLGILAGDRSGDRTSQEIGGGNDTKGLSSERNLGVIFFLNTFFNTST
jgi:hypothetical protein